MTYPLKERTVLWHEDSAIWEIIAGEMVAQESNPISGDQAALVERAREGASDALGGLRAGNKDGAGHALIGAALALALAARVKMVDEVPIENFAGEFAAAVSWTATLPGEEEISLLISELQPDGIAISDETAPTLWELAVVAGGYAAGLSPFISRRRQRRDVVEAESA